MVAIAAVVDLIVWAAYRLDKLCARRNWRRISENTLLCLTLFGGSGALLGMYAHRQRHKTQKAYFVWTAILATVLQVTGLVALGYAIATRR